jgi:hypothetical protein
MIPDCTKNVLDRVWDPYIMRHQLPNGKWGTVLPAGNAQGFFLAIYYSCSGAIPFPVLYYMLYGDTL